MDQQKMHGCLVLWGTHAECLGRQRQEDPLRLAGQSNQRAPGGMRDFFFKTKEKTD